MRQFLQLVLIIAEVDALVNFLISSHFIRISLSRSSSFFHDVVRATNFRNSSKKLRPPGNRKLVEIGHDSWPLVLNKGQASVNLIL